MIWPHLIGVNITLEEVEEAAGINNFILIFIINFPGVQLGQSFVSICPVDFGGLD